MVTSLSVKDICGRHRVNASKVGVWIARGELKAINVAAQPGAKARWRILPEDLAAFEASRSAPSRPAPSPPRRRRADPSVTQYF
jgi:hypothetical protein